MAFTLLVEVRPFLIVKKPQTDLIMAIYEPHTVRVVGKTVLSPETCERRRRALIEMRRLNQRGLVNGQHRLAL